MEEAYRKQHAARSEREPHSCVPVFRLYEVTLEERRDIEKIVKESRAVTSGEEPAEAADE